MTAYRLTLPWREHLLEVSPDQKTVQSASSTLIEQLDGVTDIFISIGMLNLNLTWEVLNSNRVTNLSPQNKTKDNNIQQHTVKNATQRKSDLKVSNDVLFQNTLMLQFLSPHGYRPVVGETWRKCCVVPMMDWHTFTEEQQTLLLALCCGNMTQVPAINEPYNAKHCDKLKPNY